MTTTYERHTTPSCQRIAQKVGEVLLGAVAGIGIGTLITLVVSASYGNAFTPTTPAFLAQFENPHTAVAISYACYALIGMVGTVAGWVFDHERVSLLTTSIINYVLVVGVIFACGLYLHWVPAGWALVGFFLVESAIWLVIWCAIYWSTKRSVDEINSKLQR